MQENDSHGASPALLVGSSQVTMNQMTLISV